jgi:hypothetical protein
MEAHVDKDTRYRKTGSGMDAIATRHPGLPARQRSLLILVDGRRTAGELAVLTAAFGDTQELLQALLGQGFIEVVEQVHAVPSRPAPLAPAPARQVDGEAVPLAKARSLASRRLIDLLGPGASELCMKLEATRTAEEFRGTLRRVEGILREVVGSQRAAQFVTEVESLRAS